MLRQSDSSLISARLRDVIEKAEKELNRKITEQSSEYRDSTWLKNQCHIDDFRESIDVLKQLIYSSISYEETFKGAAKKRYNLTRDSGLSFLAAPDSPANQLFNTCYHIIYGNDKKLFHYLQIFAPDVDTLVDIDFKRPLDKKHKLENLSLILKEKNITDNQSLIDHFVPSEIVIDGNKMLLVEQALEFIHSPVLLHQARSQLSQYYPGLYKKLISHNKRIEQLYIDAAKKPIPLRVAIERLSYKLKESGTDVTKQAHASPLAVQAIDEFQFNFDLLPIDIQKKANAIQMSGGPQTLHSIIQKRLVEDGICVQTASGFLDQILSENRDNPILDYASSIQEEKSTPSNDESITKGRENSKTFPLSFIEKHIKNHTSLAYAFILLQGNNYQELIQRYKPSFDENDLKKMIISFDHDQFKFFLKAYHSSIKLPAVLVIFYCLKESEKTHFFYEIIKNKLPSLISNVSDFRAITVYLTLSQRAFLLKQINLFGFIKKSDDFFATDRLDEASVEALFQFFKSSPSKYIHNNEDLINICLSFGPSKSGEIFQLIKSEFPRLFTSLSHFVRLSDIHWFPLSGDAPTEIVRDFFLKSYANLGDVMNDFNKQYEISRKGAWFAFFRNEGLDLSRLSIEEQFKYIINEAMLKENGRISQVLASMLRQELTKMIFPSIASPMSQLSRLQ